MTTHDEVECPICWLDREIGFAYDCFSGEDFETLENNVDAWLGDNAKAVADALREGQPPPGVDIVAGSAEGSALIAALFDSRTAAAHDLAPDALAAAAEAAGLIAALRGTGGWSGDDLEAAIRR